MLARRISVFPLLRRQLLHIQPIARSTQHPTVTSQNLGARARHNSSILKSLTECSLGLPRTHHNHAVNAKLVALLAGILGLFGFHDNEDEGERVPTAVKRELLRAQRAHRSSDYSTAEHCYHNALHMLGSTEHAQTQAYIEARAVTMDKLANLYLEQRRYIEAEATLKETLGLIIAAGAMSGLTEQEAMVEISLKLSKIYSNQQRYDEADVGFQWCVENAKKCLNSEKTEDRLALLGICLESQGKYFMIVDKPKEAIEAYGEAKKIAIELFGVNSIQYATLLADEANAVLNLKHLDSISRAEQLLLDSLRIMESLSYSEVAQNLAVTSYNLATVLALQSATEPKIEEYLLKSISILEALKDDSMFEDLQLYYYKLGSFRITQGRVEDARKALEKARDLANRTGNSTLLHHINSALNTTK